MHGDIKNFLFNSNLEKEKLFWQYSCTIKIIQNKVGKKKKKWKHLLYKGVIKLSGNCWCAREWKLAFDALLVVFQKENTIQYILDVNSLADFVHFLSPTYFIGMLRKMGEIVRYAGFQESRAKLHSKLKKNCSLIA